MKVIRFAALAVCLMFLASCGPGETTVGVQPARGYKEFSAAYAKNRGLSDTGYTLSVVYHLTLSYEDGSVKTADVELSGSMKTKGIGGNNISFLSSSTLKWPMDVGSDQSGYYGDGKLYMDSISEDNKTRTKNCFECTYGMALDALPGHYEFMNFPESAVLAQDDSGPAGTFRCTLDSGTLSSYLYTFADTPLYTVIGTETTKWQYGDITLENIIGEEGYLAGQRWSVTAEALIPVQDSPNEYMETAVEISAELTAVNPGAAVEITPPPADEYTFIPR